MKLFLLSLIIERSFLSENFNCKSLKLKAKSFIEEKIQVLKHENDFKSRKSF